MKKRLLSILLLLAMLVSFVGAAASATAEESAAPEGMAVPTPMAADPAVNAAEQPVEETSAPEAPAEEPAEPARNDEPTAPSEPVEAPEETPAEEAAPVEPADTAETEPAAEPEEDAAEETEETEEPVELVYRTIELWAEKTVLYEPAVPDDGHLYPTEPLTWITNLWSWMFGREIKTEEHPDPLHMWITGWLPEDVTAEASYIQFAEPDVYSEYALLDIDLALYDAEGEEYVPEDAVQIELSGGAVSYEIEHEHPFFVYANWEDDRTEWEMSHLEPGFTASMLVWRDRTADKERLSYETGKRQNNVMFTESVYTPTADQWEGTVSFKTELMPTRFVLTSQRPDRRVTAQTEDGATEVSVIGALSTAVSAEVTPVEAGETTLGAWDVSLSHEEEGALQPDTPVTVTLWDESITAAQAEGWTLELWSLDEAGEPAEAVDAYFYENCVEFTADEVAAYALVETVFEKTLEASDGQTYSVTVEYSGDESLPPETELSVSEILPDTDEYNEYIAQSAEHLGAEVENLSLARAFDISLIDVETGEEIVPPGEVTVSIRLLDTELNNDAELDVVHFGDEIETMDCALEDDAVVFTDDACMAYVVVSVDMSLDAALASAQDGDTVQLSGDTSGSIANLDKSLILDLNGHTLTIENTEDGGIVSRSGSSLTITNGTLVSSSESLVLHANGGSITLGDNLTVSSPLVVHSDSGGTVTIDGASVNDTVTVENGANLTITGGKITGTISTDNSTVTVTGGQFTQSLDLSWISEGSSTVTITAGGSKVYDGTPLAAYMVSGLPAGYTVEDVTVSGRQTVVGTCESSVTGAVVRDGEGQAAANCVILLGSGMQEVTARPITILDTVSADKVYDGTTVAVIPAESISGLLDADVGRISVAGSFDNANFGTQKTVTLSLEGEGAENYTLDTALITADITPKAVTVTADDKKKLFNDPDPVFTAAVEGLLDGDTLEYTLTRAAGEELGEYAVTPAGEDLQGNYAVTYVPGTLRIMDTTSAITVTITGHTASTVYDGEEHAVSGYDVVISTEALTEDRILFSGTANAVQTNAGTAAMGLTAAMFSLDPTIADMYYVDFQVTDGYVTVEPAPVTLTAESAAANYDGAEHTLSGYTCSVDGLTFAGVSASASGTEKGTYPLEISGVTINETRDSSGNYVVAETVSGQLVIAALLTKELESFSGNLATYKIIVNPDGVQLNQGRSITLKDTFSYDPEKHKNDPDPRIVQSIYYDSVTVSPSAGVLFDYSGYTGTFTLPDETPLTITYTTRALGSAGDVLAIEEEDSIATLGAMKSGTFAAWGSDAISETRTIGLAESDISGESGEYTVRIYTYADGHMERGLGGAQYRLLDYNQKPVVYKKGENAGQQVTFTTGADGFATIRLTEEEDGVSIHKNTVYYLEMIKAPIAENGDGTYTYFQKDNTRLNFLITDSPEYSFGDSGIYTYFNGDVMKVRCYEESVGINVTTIFSGNYTLTNEQKNNIVFVLEKENTATGTWDEVERHAYSDFSWGSMRFATGKNGWSAQDYGATYRVIVENADIEGVKRNTTCVVSFQSNGATVSDEQDEFLVDPDHEAYSFSLAFTLEYYENELTFYALEEELGILLEGVTFTAYKAADDSEIASYQTDDTGTTVIRRTDSYASDTLYYAVQTAAPDGYLLPDEPEKVYFYFSENNMLVPAGLPAGESALDLSKSYATVAVSNLSDKLDFPVIVTWGLTGVGTWPGTVDHVLVELHRSVDGGASTAVDGMSVVLNAGDTFDTEKFRDLPRQDASGHTFTYTLEETVFADAAGTQDVTQEYAVSGFFSGSGWYVIRNQASVGVTVEKAWFALDGVTTAGAPAGATYVSFDLYRTTETFQDTTATRQALEEFLDEKGELVQSGLTLSAAEGWARTVYQLPETDSENHPYSYYALEDEASMPENQADSYEITPAADSALRTLTIRNTQTPITVIIEAQDASKTYGQDDPAFGFAITVQDESTTAKWNVDETTGGYNVVVTAPDNSTKTLSFTLDREVGDSVGSYTLTPVGAAEQEGYRIKYQSGILTIGRAAVTVTAGAEKTYGEADPELVTVEGMQFDEDPASIRYEVYREPGEDVDTYEIWLSGESVQGNYSVKFANGLLTIARAEAVVTANPMSKVYGEADGELTATVSGLEHGDGPGVIQYSVTREDGEDADTYQITPNGDEYQGNYHVTFSPNTYTIHPAPLTVSVADVEISYGDTAPDWDVTLYGLLGDDAAAQPTVVQNGNTYTYTYELSAYDPSMTNTLSFDLDWDPSENVGEYDVTVHGENRQGNYAVTYESGTLRINRAVLTVRADDIVKDVAAPDPQLTATVTGWKNTDGESVLTSTTEEGVVTCVYKLEETELLRFTLRRTSGDTVGDYTITAEGSYNQGNYEVEYDPGTFSILPVYDVDVRQVTSDRVSPAADPEYSYQAIVDLTGTGLTSLAGYTKNDSGLYVKTFVLGGTNTDLETLKIPVEAKLTVIQLPDPAADDDYETTITLDGDIYSGAEGVHRCVIDSVDEYYAMGFTHTRICLPVVAMAGVAQTEEGAQALTPSGFIGIPDGEQPVNEEFSRSQQTAIGYSLPSDKYYGFHHAVLVHEDGSSVGGAGGSGSVAAIRYNKASSNDSKWEYRTDETGSEFSPVPDDAVLRLYYYPKYICKIGTEKFYTLNSALDYMQTQDPVMTEATIEMLLGRFDMPVTDTLTVPEGYSITITTAATEYEGESGTSAVISRSPTLSGNLFVNNGTLILDNIVLDGDGGNISGADAMIRNEGTGTLSVNTSAVLRNANGVNGGAIYVSGGEATIHGSLSCNTATYGGAMYVTGGKVTLSGTVGGAAAADANTATYGGAVFVTGGEVEVTGGTVAGNTATNGGAFYLQGGTLKVSGGTVSGNTASTDGGMLYAVGGNVDVTAGTITGNTATDGNGGAVYYAGPGTVTISGGTIQSNKAERGNGGAVYQTSGTVTVSGTIGGGAIATTANMAKNGSAIYVHAGTANFTGCSITYNKTTTADGGAVGVDADARLFFSGDSIVKENKNSNNGDRNVYLDEDSDEIINVPAAGLGGSAEVRIFVDEDVRDERGEVCCCFGSYVGASNLGRFKDDRGIYNVYSVGNKLYWGKSINFIVRYLGSGFPPNTGSGKQLKGSTSYYPKNTTNPIYDLVTTLYNEYYNTLIESGTVYSYSFANGVTAFEKSITSVNWDSTNRKWVFVQSDGTTTTNQTSFTIYYQDAAYLSITNNQPHALTIDALTVNGKNAVADGYGYVVAINNVTQTTMRPITAANLRLAAGDSIRLVFPGATGAAWTISGVFDAGEGDAITYSLQGGTAQTLTTTAAEGRRAFSLPGTLASDKGVIYNVLFGEPPYICKVVNDGVEHPFATLNDAVDYITDGETVLDTPNTAVIEMLMDYQQPADDILAVPEGYNITLTTADAEGSTAAAGMTYTYKGDGVDTENPNNPARATISRSSGDMGSAVTTLIKDGTAVLTTDTECTTRVTISYLIFDGKALGQGGQGGAINTSNVILNINHCDFRGYTAVRGGAVYAKWGQLTVENSNFTNCKILPEKGADKTGGGGIWSTAKIMNVTDCTFINCVSQSLSSISAQGGAIFHNIRYDGAAVHTSDSQKFPTGFSNGSETHITGCYFKDCTAVGSGGTIESDAWMVYITDCEIYGGKTTKNNGNGGAINVYTNDYPKQQVPPTARVEIKGCIIENCSAPNGDTNGGAIRTLSPYLIVEDTIFRNTMSNKIGGAISMDKQGTSIEITRCVFDSCSTKKSDGHSGAVYANAPTVSITDSLFMNCTSPKYGGVYQSVSANGSSLTVTDSSFENCSSMNSDAGALRVAAKTLSVSGKYAGQTYTYRDENGNEKTETFAAKNHTFSNCSATLAGGAVYHSGTTETLTNCSFDGCSSGSNGGGAYLAATTITSSGTTVTNCRTAANGGGLYISPGTSATFTGGSFAGNWVTNTDGKGGALYIEKNTVTLNNVAFEKTNGTTVRYNAAAFGGGIYQQAGTLNLNGATVSDCYATISGGGLYHLGTVNAYGSFTGCHAGTGGGIYSAGTLNFNNAANAMTVSGCHAKAVTLNTETGVASAAATYAADNLGGGIYNAGTFTQSSAAASVTGCHAYNGGGVYNAGTFTLSGGSITGNNAENNGGGVYYAGGTFAMSGGAIGAEDAANTAAQGGGVFVADNRSLTMSGGGITYNQASTAGGGIAVGGSGSRLYFQSTVTVRHNKMGLLDCNVYLDQDSNAIINTTGTALAAGSYIGVYASNAQDDAHGKPGCPFGTYSKDNNLNRFFNDRRRYHYGAKGSSNNEIVWVDFTCKIADANGRLLYKDAACTVPAAFPILENSGGNESAFGWLGAQNALYARDENGDPIPEAYSGAYQVQMLVSDYQLSTGITLDGQTVTLTTASTEADACGFKYSDPKYPYAPITRAASFGSMITVKNGSLTLSGIILDGGYEPEKGRTIEASAGTNGGILIIQNSSSAVIGENATLRNSKTTGNGGGVRVHGNGAVLTLSGGTIENCSGVYGGGVSVKQGTFTMSGGTITGCSAQYGGGVRIDTTMSMSGGVITGNSAVNDGGGISLDSNAAQAKVTFSGSPVVTGNTRVGLDADNDGEDDACNVQLSWDNNAVINTTGLEPEALIGIFTTGSIFTNHGDENKPFGTRSQADTGGLYCFVNDISGLCGGRISESDLKIYWLGRPVLEIRNAVSSDWSADESMDFTFTITLGITPNLALKDYGFDDGQNAVFTLKHNENRILSLPTSLNEIPYTVTQTPAEDFTTTVQKDDGEPEDSNVHSGRLGENNNGTNQATGTTVLSFTNTRVTGDITVSKSVDSRYEEDRTEKIFSFILRLGDTANDHTYSCVDQNGDPIDDVTFVNGVAALSMKHDEAITIQGLPKTLPFTVTENLGAADRNLFQVRIGKNGAASELVGDNTAPTMDGTVGEVVGTDDLGKTIYTTSIEFSNIRKDVVCKITDRNGNLLYYKDGDELVPAVYFHLEDAFNQVNNGGLRTGADGNASGTMRIEMVVPSYTVERSVTLDADKTVILTTALTAPADGKYPYEPGDSGRDTAEVTRGFDGESMIVARGTLTVDNITLDGGNEDGRYATHNGGIIRAENSRLTISENATLRNSRIVGEGHNGGAVWIGENVQLTMNGTIENCSAYRGGGIYADADFRTVTIGTSGDTGGSQRGIITGCAAADSGGALYAGATTSSSGITIYANTSLTNNTAGADGGAVWSGASLKVRGGTIKDNSAGGNGGGIYLSGSADLNMSGGTIENNKALNGNGGGIYATGDTHITGGSFVRNSAAGSAADKKGMGGAIYADSDAEVTLSGTSTSYSENTARLGGVIGSKGMVTMLGGSMEENTATEGGSAVYVEAGSEERRFTMSGGSIRDNISPKGAVLTSGENAKLYFSGSSVVAGNTYTDGTTKMDVYLNYNDTGVINSTGLKNSASIGIYVADGYENGTYYSHGIAVRNFATYIGSDPERAGLNAFFNDRDEELFGECGELIDNGNGEYYIMWPGKTMRIQVYQFDVQDDGVTPVEQPAPIAGAAFTLTNITPGDPNINKVVWTGSSDENGLVEIDWKKVEEANGYFAVFKQYSQYELRQTTTDDGCVLPAGYWELYVDRDNTVSWSTKPSADANVNRTIPVRNPVGEGVSPELGETFILYNDREPRIIFDANGGYLIGDGKSQTETDRTEDVPFGKEVGSADLYSVRYEITEANPAWYTKFLRWATDKVPTESTVYYSKGDTIDFYRHSDNDDVILYAQWVPVVCKITDRDDNLLYVDGEPAIYATLQDAFADFNTRRFTLENGKTGTPRKIKMLVEDYALTEPVALARGKTAILTTASASDRDVYLPPAGVTTCTITRAFDNGESMIQNTFSLTLMNIVLDGGQKAGSIVSVAGDFARLTMASGAVLRNAGASSDSGAVRAGDNTTVDMSDGRIIGNNGIGIYLENGSTLNLAGGTITANAGGGIYLAEGSTMKISGAPSFGGTGSGSGNLVPDAVESGSKNGGDSYAGDNHTAARKDIVIAGYAGTETASSLVVTGNMTGAKGSIWVWAEQDPHYLADNQFATYSTGSAPNGLAVFRNAQADSVTTGFERREYLCAVVKDDDPNNYIYWGTEGLDVSFRKVDSFGNALAGATFTLYKDDNTTVQDTQSSGDNGIVTFEKVPNGIYYLKETDAPTGYRENTNTYIVLVGSTALKDTNTGLWADGEVLGSLSEEDAAAQSALYESNYSAFNRAKGDYAIFLLDSTIGEAAANPNIAKSGIENASAVQRHVILRKTDPTYKPVYSTAVGNNATFDILRMDGSVVASDLAVQPSGVFWIGDLPLGTYYVHETQVPEGYQKLGTNDNWFILTVTESGGSNLVQTEAHKPD